MSPSRCRGRRWWQISCQRFEHRGVFDADNFQTDGEMLQFQIRENTISFDCRDRVAVYGDEVKNMATFRLATRKCDKLGHQRVNSIPGHRCPAQELLKLGFLSDVIGLLPEAATSFVIITVKFKEPDAVCLPKRWAEDCGVPRASKYQGEAAVALLSKYPGQDIGVLIIHRRLPPNATSYNVEEIFFVAPARENLNQAHDRGFGIVLRADDRTALVQFANMKCQIDSQDIKTSYRYFITGLPFPPSHPA